MAPKSQKLWHPIWKDCYSTWKKHFPQDEYEHIMWTDDKISDFIEEEYPEYFFLYHAFPFKIMGFDIARCLVLHKYGGIYTDMDYFCVKNFYDDLNKNLILVEGTNPSELVQNSLMCSKKGHEFWIKYLELVEYRYHDSCVLRNYPRIRTPEFSEYVLRVTGPGCLEKTVKVYNKINKEQIQILDRSIYNSIMLDIESEKNYKQIKCFHALTGKWGYSNVNEITGKEMSQKHDQILLDRHKKLRLVDFYDLISNFE